MKIFVFSAGEQTGPYTKEAIRKELLNGSLKSSDLAWHNRLRRWVPLQHLPMIEPQSKKKFPMPPNPEDSPFFLADETAPASALQRRKPQARKWFGWISRLFG